MAHSSSVQDVASQYKAWPYVYKPGQLAVLRLEAGRYGTDDFVPVVDQRLVTAPAAARVVAAEGGKPITWPSALWHILSRTPGGVMSLDCLFRTALEWCPAIANRTNREENQACRSALCKKKDIMYFTRTGAGNLHAWKIIDAPIVGVSITTTPPLVAAQEEATTITIPTPDVAQEEATPTTTPTPVAAQVEATTITRATTTVVPVVAQPPAFIPRLTPPGERTKLRIPSDQWQSYQPLDEGDRLAILAFAATEAVRAPELPAVEPTLAPEADVAGSASPRTAATVVVSSYGTRSRGRVAPAVESAFPAESTAPIAPESAEGNPAAQDIPATESVPVVEARPFIWDDFTCIIPTWRKPPPRPLNAFGQHQFGMDLCALPWGQGVPRSRMLAVEGPTTASTDATLARMETAEIKAEKRQRLAAEKAQRVKQKAKTADQKALEAREERRAFREEIQEARVRRFLAMMAGERVPAKRQRPDQEQDKRPSPVLPLFKRRKMAL